MDVTEKPRSSKSCRLRDFLPSIRPSFLSLILFCACGYLWLRNETLNDRMIALENRLNKFLREDRVVTDDSPQEVVGSTPSKPTATKLPDYKTGKNRLHCAYVVTISFLYIVQLHAGKKRRAAQWKLCCGILLESLKRGKRKSLQWAIFKAENLKRIRTGRDSK